MHLCKYIYIYFFNFMVPAYLRLFSFEKVSAGWSRASVDLRELADGLSWANLNAKLGHVVQRGDGDFGGGGSLRLQV